MEDFIKLSGIDTYTLIGDKWVPNNSKTYNISYKMLEKAHSNKNTVFQDSGTYYLCPRQNVVHVYYDISKRYDTREQSLKSLLHDLGNHINIISGFSSIEMRRLPENKSVNIINNVSKEVLAIMDQIKEKITQPIFQIPVKVYNVLFLSTGEHDHHIKFLKTKSDIFLKVVNSSKDACDEISRKDYQILIVDHGVFIKVSEMNVPNIIVLGGGHESSGKNVKSVYPEVTSDDLYKMILEPNTDTIKSIKK